MECDLGCCRGPQSLKSTRLSFLVQVVRPPKLPDPVSEICHQLQQVGIRWESGSRTGLRRLQIKNQKQRCLPLSKRQALRREIRAIRSSLKKRRRRQSLNATNTPSPATIRISAPGAKRRQGREDPIDRPMEHHAEILGSITRLTSRSRRSSWTVLQYPDPTHPLLLPKRRTGLRGHARRDKSDRQGGRFQTVRLWNRGPAFG